MELIKCTALTVLLAAAAPALAQGSAAPKAAATCFACHGENGAKPIAPNYPVLAGQYANYIEHALNEYKEGKRKNPIMGAQAAALSAADIHDLAEFFSQQPSSLHTPTVHGAEQGK